ncbi:MAG: PAS domain S-box protein [Robiginitomaculum sp.]|nr:PAS domain S-box protein [Robiginitomaculum sp.]
MADNTDDSRWSGFGIIVTEWNGNSWVIIEINDVELENLGYCAEELIGQTPEEIMEVPNSDRSAILQAQQTVRNGLATSFIARFKHKDGSIYATRTLVSGEYDKNDKIIRYHYTSSRVDPNNSELFTQDHRQMMNRTERMTGVGSWSYSLEQKKLIVSDNIYAIFMVPEANKNSVDFKKIFPESLVKEYTELNRKSVIDGEPYSQKYHFFSADGTEFYGKICGEPQYNKHGIITGVAGVVSDLSDETNMRIANNMFLRAGKLGSIRIDDRKEVLSLSAEAARLIGEPSFPLQITAKNWLQRIHPDDREQASAEYQKSIKSKTPAIRKYRILHADGRWIWFEIRSDAKFSDSDQPAIIYATIMDIDDRIRTDAKIIENEKRFNDVLNQSREVIYELDAKGYFQYISDSGPELFGYSNGELLTMTAYDLIAEPDFTHEEWLSFRHSQGALGNEILLAHKTGKELFVQFSSVPIRNKEGIILGFRGTARDITEQKNAQIKLQKSKQRLRDVVSTAQGWIFDLDTEGCFTFSENHISYFENSDLTIENLRGKPTYSMAPALADRHQEWLDMILRSPGGLASEIELAAPETDGTIWARIHCVARYDEDGQCIGYRGVAFDITAQKQAQLEIVHAKEEAEASAEERSRFLSTMSHEIRTPLNAVIGMTDLLLDSTLDQQQKKLTKTANMAGKHLLCLINDILDHAKLDAGKVVLEEIEFAPKQEIKNVFDILAGSAEEKHLSLTMPANSDIADIYVGDPARFRQILLNLVGNAIKFTDSGSVSITATTTKPNILRFEVIDTGPGIAPEVQTKLFKDFAQADASTTRKHGGTGLGLAICKRLVEVMGGKIGVSSVLDQGSTFWFEIPLKPAQSSTATKTTQSGERQLGKFNVLVAEDNPANQLLIRTVLEKLDQSVTIVENGLLVVEAANTEKFDLIFMDIQMPEMDGLTAAKVLRDSGNSIPIIALTANTIKDEEHRFQQSGMNDWLTKPFNIQDFVQKLMYWGNYSNQQEPSKNKPVLQENSAR